MKILATIILILGLAAPVHAAELIPLTLNSGAIPCVGTPTFGGPLFNPEPQDIYIKIIKVWVGLDRTRMADQQLKIWNHRGEVFPHHNDRYGDTTEQPSHVVKFSPDHILLKQGQHLWVGMGCHPQPPKATGFNTHFTVNIWYTLQP